MIFDGFSPYILGDVGYPCLSWLLVPHPENHALPIAAALYNRKHCTGRCVVENAFTILKQTFKELLNKIELAMTFVPDVITDYALMHNMLLRQSTHDVDHLLQVLRTKGFSENNDENIGGSSTGHDTVLDERPLLQGIEKQRALGLHLTGQQGLHV